MAVSNGSSHGRVDAGRRAKGESSPTKRPTCCPNDSRVMSSWSWALMSSMIYRRCVTVSARPAKDLPLAANLEPGPPTIGVVDMREGSSVRAGTFPYDGGDLVTGWHSHDLPQIAY